MTAPAVVEEALRFLQNDHLKPVIGSMTPAGWPQLTDDALYGLAGDIVRAIEPHTEGHPAALLVNTLVMAGNAIGPAPYMDVSDTRHHAHEFAALVGATSKGRKGTSHASPLRIVGGADPAWARTRITGGVSSGEGIIWPIRDPIERMKQGETVVDDEGVADKRLLIVQSELSQLFKVCRREGNTLSEILRQAWDGHRLGVMTRNSPYHATNPHVSFLGHITGEELRRVADDTDLVNGLANRFLWVCVKRSKLLPEGDRLPEDQAAELTHRLSHVFAASRKIGEMRRDATATELWADIYGDLSDAKPGMFGAVVGRAEAHVLRPSMLYALLHASATITADHLTAALALWDYCEASARYLFGDATGDPVADRILRALRATGPMTQTEVSGVFGRNQSSGRLAAALEVLSGAGLIHAARESTGGRDAVVWSARP